YHPHTPARTPPIAPLFPYTTLFRSTCAAPPNTSRKAKGTLIDSMLRPRIFPIPPVGAAKLTRRTCPRTMPCRLVSGYFARSSERSEEHTSELQSRFDLVCRLLLEKK